LTNRRRPQCRLFAPILRRRNKIENGRKFFIEIDDFHVGALQSKDYVRAATLYKRTVFLSALSRTMRKNKKYAIFRTMTFSDRQNRKSYGMLRMSRAIGRAIDAGTPAEQDRAIRWVAAWGLIGGIRSDTVRLRNPELLRTDMAPADATECDAGYGGGVPPSSMQGHTGQLAESAHSA
jgi:hypothetical protein